MAAIRNEIRRFLNLNKSFQALLALTFAGIIPFVSLTLLLYIHLLPQANVLQILTTYAAVILTFLGGIQWGISVIRLENKTLTFPHVFTLSILPSLIAWLILLLNEPKLKLMGFIFSFIFVLIVDFGLAFREIIPSWFLKLRFGITIIVTLLLIIAYFAL